MRGFKYVIFQTATGAEEALLFATTLTHREVSQSFCNHFRGSKPVRAGFCSVDTDGGFHTYGDSESLKLQSDPMKDSKMLDNINERGY